MLNHYGGRDAPALPVVDSLQHASIGREAKQLGKSGIPTGCGDEVACFDGCHSRDCKHSVYAMSNSLCTRPLNRPFIIRTVVTTLRQWDIVQRLLDAKGWSNSDLARAIGASRQTVNNWQARGAIPARNHKQVAECLGVTIDQLVGRTASPAALPVMAARSNVLRLRPRASSRRMRAILEFGLRGLDFIGLSS